MWAPRRQPDSVLPARGVISAAPSNYPPVQPRATPHNDWRREFRRSEGWLGKGGCISPPTFLSGSKAPQTGPPALTRSPGVDRSSESLGGHLRGRGGRPRTPKPAELTSEGRETVAHGEGR